MNAMNKLRGVAAVFVLGMLLLLSSGGPAAASAPSNWVSVAQTVLVSTNANGQVSGKPVVFTQLAANGSGPVTVEVPMLASGFRNLTGLTTPPITNGYAVWNMHLSGQASGRTIADFPTARLPLQVSASYELNGQQMPPNDIVGKSGLLKVTYDINNATTEATTVTFKNVFGAKETATVEAPVPYAAVVDVTFPARFTNLEAAGATISGDGNGNTAASWTMFLFNPLGGLNQSVTYQAQVTNAVVPSATVEAQALPPETLKPLPTVSEPKAPAVPTVTIGAGLASLQVGLQMKLQQLAAKASTVLSDLKAVLVPAAQDVSKGAAQASSGVAKVATLLGTLSASASNLSTSAGDVSAQLAMRSAEASAITSMAATVGTRVTALPAAICGALGKITKVPPACESTVAAAPAYTLLHSEVTALETLAVTHAAGLVANSGTAKTLQALAASTSANLTASSTSATALSAQLAGLSAKAAQAAGTLATALTPKPSHPHGKTIQPKQVGGGAKIDAAVGQLDAAITNAGNTVDHDYAYLTALNTQATQNQLPAGNATGATVQAGALAYSIAGADTTQQSISHASLIGALVLLLGGTIGLSLWRIRRGEASSLYTPKKTSSSPAPAKA